MIYCFVLAPTTLLQWNYTSTKMLLGACIAPVVAPRLFKGPSRTLRERAVAGHLPLDRQGQRESSSHQQKKFVPHTMESWNWRASFDFEFLHTTTQIVIFRTKRFSPWLTRMSWCHENHRHEFLRSLHRASAEHPGCIRTTDAGHAPSWERGQF